MISQTKPAPETLPCPTCRGVMMLKGVMPSVGAQREVRTFVCTHCKEVKAVVVEPAFLAG